MMNQDQAKLFDELKVASANLATVAHNASIVLSEYFENMVKEQVLQVQEILRRCEPPQARVWDGVLREEDCDIKIVPGAAQTSSDARLTGVQIVHRATGIGRTCKTWDSTEQNKRAAWKALEKALSEVPIGTRVR